MEAILAGGEANTRIHAPNLSLRYEGVLQKGDVHLMGYILWDKIESYRSINRVEHMHCRFEDGGFYMFVGFTPKRSHLARFYTRAPFLLPGARLVSVHAFRGTLDQLVRLGDTIPIERRVRAALDSSIESQPLHRPRNDASVVPRGAKRP